MILSHTSKFEFVALCIQDGEGTKDHALKNKVRKLYS